MAGLKSAGIPGASVLGEQMLDLRKERPLGQVLHGYSREKFLLVPIVSTVQVLKNMGWSQFMGQQGLLA